MAEQTLLDVDVINKALASVTYDPDLIDFIVALQGANTTMSSIHSSMTAYRDAYLALYQSIPTYSGDNVSGEEDVTIPERVHLEREPLAATLNGLRSYIAILLKLYRAQGTYQVTGYRTILVDQIESVSFTRDESQSHPDQMSFKPRQVTVDTSIFNMEFSYSVNAPGEVRNLGSPLITNGNKVKPKSTLLSQYAIDLPTLEQTKASFTTEWDDDTGVLSVNPQLTNGELSVVCSQQGETNVTSGGALRYKYQMQGVSTGPKTFEDNFATVSVVSGDIDGVSHNVRFAPQISSRSKVPVRVSIVSDVSKYKLFQDLLRPVAECVAAYIRFVQNAVGSSAYSEDDISVLEG